MLSTGSSVVEPSLDKRVVAGSSPAPWTKFMTNDWRKRFEDALAAFRKLKSLTKAVPASQWTPEYRELAEAIHTAGREHFYVDPEDFMQT